ncbi:MAG: murein biosynthesis integral membrane protein MurJ [Candidatus Paceibacterota bacterium]|jgi:putative peptidoglycan lipid II flippase
MSIRDFFNSEQKSIKIAAFVMIIAVLMSRFLGLIRDRLLAGTFGASIDLDIYYAAFRMPDLIYSIIFAGGIIVSFLPIFSEYQKKNKEDSWKISNSILNLFAILYGIFFVIFFFVSPDFISALIGNFSLEYQAKAVGLTRLIFVAVFFFGLSSIFSTILNYFNRFVAYSLAPAFYNLGIILGTIFLSPYFGIYGAGIGVVVGAFLHFAIQVPVAIKCGYKYEFILNLRHPGISNFFKLVIPRIVASSSSQVNFLAATFFASLVGVGAISVFNLSYNLSYFPIGILGVSFATAIFPLLSKLWAAQEKQEFYTKFRQTFLEILYVAFPVGILIFILRNQIVEIIYRTGKFDQSAVAITAACLGLYFISIFTQCLVPILLRGFFSIKDTLTPTLIAIVYVITNVFLFFPFIVLFGGNPYFSFEFFGQQLAFTVPAFIHANNFLINATKSIFEISSIDNFPLLGLVLIFNLASLMEFSLLFIFLRKKVGDFGVKKIIVSFLKILASTAIMGIGAIFVMKKTAYLFGSDFVGNLLQFVLICFIAVVIYFIATLALKSPEIKFLSQYLKAKLNKNEN